MSSNPATTAPHTFVPDYSHDPSLCGYEFINRNFCGEPADAAIHRGPSGTDAERCEHSLSLTKDYKGPAKTCTIHGTPEANGEAPPERIYLVNDARLLSALAIKCEGITTVEYVEKSEHDSEVARLRQALRTSAEMLHKVGYRDGHKLPFEKCTKPSCAAARTLLKEGNG